MSNQSWPSSGSPVPPPPPGAPTPPPPPFGSAPPPPGAPPAPGYPAPPAWNDAPTKPPRPAAPVGAFLALAGAALLIVGSFLTWFTVGDVDVTGFTDDFGDTKDGPVFVAFGVLFVAFAITTLAAKRVLAVAIIAVVIGAFAVIAGLADYGDVRDAEDTLGSEVFSTGPGLPIVILGALLALAGSIVVLAKRRR